MGWGRTLLLGDIGNRLDIEDTERSIAEIRHDLNQFNRKDLSHDQKICELKKENAELKLYLASLIRLMLAKGQINLDELENMVSIIDHEDGKADGGHDGDII